MKPFHFCCVSCGSRVYEGKSDPWDNMEAHIQLHGEDVRCLTCKAPLIPPAPEVHTRGRFYNCSCTFEAWNNRWVATEQPCRIHPSHTLVKHDWKAILADLKEVLDPTPKS